MLLVNLGTPDAPTPSAVRRYLAQFLTDPRVIEIPPWLWKPILYGVILFVRPMASAKKYAAIWTKDGSPLLVHSLKQKTLLLGYLGQRLEGRRLSCRYFVRSNWACATATRASARRWTACAQPTAKRSSWSRLYPQYAASTTASAFDAVADHLEYVRRIPGLRFVETFHDDPKYIKALAQNVNDYWMKHGRPDRLVLSFHGLPRQTLDRGDPYHCLCHATARLLAQELGLAAAQWSLTFQSRFGKAPWLKPYTTDTLKMMGAEGVARVDVFCPGFVADCLETLEEIAIEARVTFLAAGARNST